MNRKLIASGMSFLMIMSFVAGCGNSKPKHIPKIEVKFTDSKKMILPEEHKKVFNELDLQNISLAANSDYSEKISLNPLNDKDIQNYQIIHNRGAAMVTLNEDNAIVSVKSTMNGMDGEKVLYDVSKNIKIKLLDAFSNEIKKMQGESNSPGKVTVPKNIPAPYNITRRAVNFLKKNYNVKEVIQQDDARYVGSNDVGHHYISMVKIRLNNGVKVARVNVHFSPDGSSYTCEARLRNPKADGT